MKTPPLNLTLPIEIVTWKSYTTDIPNDSDNPSLFFVPENNNIPWEPSERPE